jgi:hypothetical protein
MGRDFSLHIVQTGFEAHKSSSSMGSKRSFAGYKATEL